MTKVRCTCIYVLYRAVWYNSILWYLDILMIRRGVATETHNPHPIQIFKGCKSSLNRARIMG